MDFLTQVKKDSQATLIGSRIIHFDRYIKNRIKNNSQQIHPEYSCKSMYTGIHIYKCGVNNTINNTIVIIAPYCKYQSTLK